MIEPWSLPSPVALTARIVIDLVDGRQCLLYGEPMPGLRRAIEDALALQQIRLRVIYNDDGLTAEEMMRREGVGMDASNVLPAGVWWIDGVTSASAPDWIVAAEQMAERLRQRDDPLTQRALLVVLLPIDPPSLTGLDVKVHHTEVLGRIDLEVAARYTAAAVGECGSLGRLRIELAVEMASALLPRAAALDMLQHWMTASDEALCNPRRLAEHARASGIELVLPEFELWRAQHATLLAEIERQRLKIVRIHQDRWRLPYYAAEPDGRPAKLVSAAELLELKHLCTQLRNTGESPRSPLLERLKTLRDLRNALSHLEPVGLVEITALQSPFTI